MMVRLLLITIIPFLFLGCLEKQGKSSNEVIDEIQKRIDTLNSSNQIRTSGPRLVYFSDGGSYMNENPYSAAVYHFKQDATVIFTAASIEAVETNGQDGFQTATIGEYSINNENQVIEFSNWDDILSPKGDVNYEVENDTIVALVNGKGMRFMLNTQDGRYRSVKSDIANEMPVEDNVINDAPVIVYYSEGRFESISPDRTKWKEFKSTDSNIYDFTLLSEEDEYYILQKDGHNLLIKLPKYGGMIFISFDNGMNWSNFFVSTER